MALFVTAAKHVAKEASKKILHPVEDLNAAERFKPLCIVERKKSFWFWKKPSMIPTMVTLDDLLTKDLPVLPNKKPFVLLQEFQEHPTLDVSGDVSTKIAKEFNLDFSAADKMSLVLKLGDIEKIEADWQSLFDALKDNPINVSHPVYEHATRSTKKTLCIVMESLSTAGEGSLEKDKKLSFATDDEVNLSKLSVITADIHVKGSLDITTSYSFKIPPGTILAYSCVEFSVNQSTGIINLHGDFDTLDDDDNPLVIEGPLENPTNAIKEEFSSLRQYSNFKELQAEFKVLLGNASNNDFQVMHILLDQASLYISKKSPNKSILISSLKHLLGNKIELPWKAVLTKIGFIVPKDASDPNAAVEFPNNDDSGILKAFMGLVDSVIDCDADSRKILSTMSDNDIRIIMDVVERQAKNEGSSVEDGVVESVIHKETAAQTFLADNGILGDNQPMLFTKKDQTRLLDVFAVFYVMLI